MLLPKKTLIRKLRRFVEEDIGHGDITTYYTIPHGTVVGAEVIAKEDGVLAGMEEALTLLEGYELVGKALVEDGSMIGVGKKVMEIEGDAATLLSIERTLLNLISRMSGIATTTNRLVEKISRAGYKTRVACTRKTAPGLSYFDKKAVMIGGGDAHRWGLDDMILIKDNHIAVVGNVKETLNRVKGKVSFSKKIEVEVASVNDAVKVAEEGIEIIMLDNFTPSRAKEAVNKLRKKALRDRVLIEASGGINEHNVLDYAAAGVDIVSLGEITQSAKALDFSLEVTVVKKNA